MIEFAIIGRDGRPTGGGARPVLPEGAVPLAPYSTQDLPRLRWTGAEWEELEIKEPDPPSAEEVRATAAAHLAEARKTAARQVNAAVDRFRKRIFTVIAGQDSLYLEKRAEAVAYVRLAERSGEPATLEDYPLLANEVGVTAPSAWQLAQIWLFRSDQFKRVGAETERLRMDAMMRIGAAPDFTSIETIEQDFNAALNSLSL